MSDVYLYVYDLSLGLAKKVSQKVLGKQIDGIWHTSIVAYDEEYWFAINGFNKSKPNKYLSKTNDIIYLGKCNLTKQEFMNILERQIQNGNYVMGDYNLLTNNCNSFSNELSLTLFNKPNPVYIMELPRTAMYDLMKTPVIGRAFKKLYKKTIKNNNTNEIDTKVDIKYENNQSDYSNYGDTLITIVKEHLNSNNIKWYNIEADKDDDDKDDDKDDDDENKQDDQYYKSYSDFLTNNIINKK